MANKQVEPIVIRGDQLLLALDVLYGLSEPVPGIDAERAHRALSRLFGIKPDHDLSGVVYVARQLDRDGTLRKVLRSCGIGIGGPGLRTVEFDVRVLLDGVQEHGFRHAVERLEKFFLAVAHGELTKADFKEVA